MAKGDYVYGAVRADAEIEAEWERVEDASESFWWIVVSGRRIERSEWRGYVYLGREGEKGVDN